jgi:hypothetical protein
MASASATLEMLCHNERIAGLNSGEFSYGAAARGTQMSERSFEFENRPIDGQSVADGGEDSADSAVAFGAEDIFHFHGLEDG